MTDTLALVREGLNGLGAPTSSEDGVRVPTTTLLPGGSVLSVLVTSQGADRFRVSDAGGARLAMLELGIAALRPADKKRATELADEAGLTFDAESFSLSNVTVDQIGAAVVHIADVSRRWANLVTEKTRASVLRPVSDVVAQHLERLAPNRVVRDAKMLGESSVQHEFDFAVIFGDERRALFEIVSPTMQSISLAHTKLGDLGRAHADWPREAVIEDPSEWAAEHIALLQQVSTHIRPANTGWDDVRFLLN